MKTLARSAGVGDSFYTTVTGKRFRGRIYPTTDNNSLPTVVFNAPRHILRVRLDEPIGAGEVFNDVVNRKFLVADNDRRPYGKTFALVQITDLASWKRTSTVLHPVTHQPMQSGLAQDLGSIYVAFEDYNKQNVSVGFNATVNEKKVLTGSPIQQGDMVNDKRVTRVTYQLGIYVGETE